MSNPFSETISELEPDEELHLASRRNSGHRPKSRWIDDVPRRVLCQVCRRRIREASDLERVVHCREVHRVECIERVEAELDTSLAADGDDPADREIQHVLSSLCQVVHARFKSKAVDAWCCESSRVELCV